MSPTPLFEALVPRADDSSNGIFGPSSPHPPTRISKQVFFIALLTLYCVALASAIARTLARWLYYKKLGSSDYFLIFAVLSLSSGVGFVLAIRDQVYNVFGSAPELAQNQSGGDHDPVDPGSFKLVVVSQVLTWLTMYSIKGGFLMFFRKLVQRIRHLEIYWWIVSAVVTGAFIATLVLSILVGVYIHRMASDPTQISSTILGGFNRVQTVYYSVTISLDAATDALVVSIPMRLLWKLQMKLLTKVSVGMILSLSMIMIVIAIIRGTLANNPFAEKNSTPSTDGPSVNIQDRITWLGFWQCVEADVAVLMLSLTAVRALIYEPKRSANDGLRVGGGEAGAGDGRSNTPAPVPALGRAKSKNNTTKGSSRNDSKNKDKKNEKDSDNGNSNDSDNNIRNHETEGDGKSVRPTRSVSSVGEGWNRPKRSRSKLVRKTGESGKSNTGMARNSSGSSKSQKRRKSKKSRDQSDMLEISSVEKRWQRTPRLPTPKLGSPLSARMDLERSPSSARLIEPASSPNEEPSDYFGDVAMVDFSTVWASPTNEQCIKRAKSRDQKKAAASAATSAGATTPPMAMAKAGARGTGRTGVFMRGAIEQEEHDEREQQAREERERMEEMTWLQRQYYDDERRVLPPPVERPSKAVRVVHMEAMNEPENKRTKRKSNGNIPGGMF